MNALLLKFSRGITIFVILIVSFSIRAFGQIINSADSSLTLITSTLVDGTKIWGTIHQETETNIEIFDFNIGKIKIEKKNVVNEIREKASGSVIVETDNGGLYYGVIVGAAENTLILKSAVLDVFEIPSNAILKITLSGESYANKKGETWFSNPNATRYFFAPSAIPLKKKEGYYQNAYLLANSINVGVTDNVTVGGGVVIPLLFYVTPKISYKVSKKLFVGAGVLFTQTFIPDMNLSAGIGYGLVTYGNREHNVTLGSGYGFSKVDNSYGATKMPIVTMNGMTRISKKISIITENWLMPRTGYQEEFVAYDNFGMPYTQYRDVKKDYYSLVGSLGMRFMPSVKTSVDFAVVGIKTDYKGNYFFIPYLDFVYKFN